VKIAVKTQPMVY